MVGIEIGGRGDLSPRDLARVSSSRFQLNTNHAGRASRLALSSVARSVPDEGDCLCLFQPPVGVPTRLACLLTYPVMKSYRASLLCGLIFGLAGLFVSGCATVTRGTKDTLVIESEPAGADVRLSNGMTGKTPTSFKLPRKHPLVVNIEKEGYEPISVNVNSQVSGAGAAGMAGNVLVGGLVGAVVDPLSGAMKDLRPNPVKVTLVPLAKDAPAAVPAAAPDAVPAPVATPTTTPAEAAPTAIVTPPPATVASAESGAK